MINQEVNNKKSPHSKAFTVVLILMFAALVIFPLFRMLFHLDHKSISSVLNSPMFNDALHNSLVASALATGISLVIAYTLAYCVQRTNIPFRSLFSSAIILPMLIPSISHGIGLIVLFGNNGVITNLFGVSSNIYGLPGIIAGSVLYACPVAFLMFTDILKYEDCLPYDAAKILGIPKWRQFVSITLPFLRKPLISIVFATFTLIITDYGIPLIVGGKYTTLPVVMYQEVIGQLNFGKGSVYGALLLLPAVVAFIIDLLNQDNGNSTFLTQSFRADGNRLSNVLSFAFCCMLSLLALLPVFAFAVLAFAKKYPFDMTFTLSNIVQTVRLGGDRYLANSILIAVIVALFGTVLAFASAYMTARIRGRLAKLLHLAILTSMAIPGIVLGLAYVLTFRNSLLYGTLGMLVIVNITHFIASPYLMMYNSLSKANENLEGIGQTLGISRLRMIVDVFLPQNRSTLLEMFSYLFVNCMMTISAVSFLANLKTKPVSLMINQFEAQMQMECAAVVSLAILLVNVVLKGGVYLIKRKNDKLNVGALHSW